MHEFKRFMRYHRRELQTAAWVTAGALLLFGALTMQLSATEGNSSRRKPSSVAPPAAKIARKPAARTASSTNHFLSPVSVDPMAFESPGDLGRPITATSMNVLPTSLSQPVAEPLAVAEVYLPTITEPVVPSSNYFGVDPNTCCDEWSGFCDCQQNSLGSKGKRCKKCQRTLQQ